MQLIRTPSLAALTVVVLATSCGDPTAPSDGTGGLVPNVVVAGRVEGVDRPVEYQLPVNPGDEFVIHFQSFARGLTLRVIDPETNQTLAQAEDWDVSGELTDVHTPRILVEEAGTLLVRVSARPETDFGDFRLRVTPVPRGPESHSSQIALNDTIRDESIDNDFDVDEFTFAGSAGQEVIAFLAAGGSGGFVHIALRILGPDGKEVTGITAHDRGSDPERTSSGIIRLPAPGTYRVRIDAWGEPLPLPYVFQVRRIDRRPESASQEIAAGDTVDTERLDHVGDVDEFVLKGPPGDSYNLFFQTVGTNASVIRGEVEGITNTVVEAQPGEALLSGATGVFTMPPGGQATVRVTGQYDQYGLFRGPYRILAYHIDPAPEHTGAALTPGLVVTERIELPGDRDRFTLAVTSQTLMNVSLRKPAGDGVGALRLIVSGPSPIHLSLSSYYLAAGEEGHIASGNLRLGTGTHEVIVEGLTSERGGFIGTYELAVFAIDTLPERLPRTAAIGDTLAGESVDHLGDIDVYSFSGTAGQSVYTFLSPADPNAQIDVAIVHPTLGRLVRSPEHIVGPLGAMRIELPTTGTYQLWVGPYETDDRRATGAYRAGVLPADPAPESRPATLAWSDTVTCERTDYRGDIDEFVVSGQPGQEVVATFSSSAWFTLNMDLSVIDPASSDVIARAGYTSQLYTGRFRVPAGGTIRLRVAERPMCMASGYCYHATGPFTLHARLVNRAPDSVDARVAVGDTVDGEAVDFPGDVDEFVFAGTAGQRIKVILRAGPPIYGDGTLTLEVVDPTTSAVLGTVSARWSNAETSAVELPATRDYVVRVRGVRDTHDGATYSFILQSAQ